MLRMKVFWVMVVMLLVPKVVVYGAEQQQVIYNMEEPTSVTNEQPVVTGEEPSAVINEVIPSEETVTPPAAPVTKQPTVKTPEPPPAAPAPVVKETQTSNASALADGFASLQ